MSTFEHLFLRSDLPMDQLANEVATALGLEQVRTDDNRIVLKRPASTAENEETGGDLYANHFADPSGDQEEEAVFDGHQYVLDVGYTGRDREVQVEEARQFFNDLVEAGRWPVVLVRGLDVLLAAWNPHAGVRWFPPYTSPDANDRDKWGPYRYKDLDSPE
jgi:hypothetical protein